MRQRIKAREWWLFTPFLLIGGLALYLGRGGKLTSPAEHWATTSTVEVEAAPGYWQEQGKLHHVTVTLAHPWPRPKWWGEHYRLGLTLDPTDLAGSARLPLGPGVGIGNEEIVRSGVIFTTEDADGKTVTPPKQGALLQSPLFDGGQCTFDYYLDLDKVIAPNQPLAIHAAYVFGENEPVELDKVIRRKGEQWGFKADKNPGAQLLGINTSSRFYRAESSPAKKPAKYSDFVYIFFLIRPDSLSGKAVEKADAQIKIYDFEIGDETGKTFRQRAPFKLFFTPYGGMIVGENQVRSGEVLEGIKMDIENILPTSGPLTLTGKISVDKHWPLTFKVKLPPRSSSSTSWGEPEKWVRPTNAVPLR